MKFTLFVLLAGLCLVAANVELPAPMEDVDFEYLSKEMAEDVTDIDSYSVTWFGIFFVIQKTLTTLKGVNCTIKEVYVIRAAAQKFLDDIQACGGEVSKKVQQLIDTCNNIISTCNDIIHLDENICGDTPASDDETAAVALKGNTPFKCFFKLFYKTLYLKNQVRKAIYLLKRIPSVPGEAGVCANTAAYTLASVFNQFPARVRTCSKLIK